MRPQIPRWRYRGYLTLITFPVIMVYYGPTEDTATTVASNLPIESGSVNPASPSIEYNAGLDLGLDHGASVCFKIGAYNDVGLSNWSGAVCGIV